MVSTRKQGKLPINRHFFKVMMPGFVTKLRFPPKFCKQLNGVKSDEAILTSRKGSWNVKVEKCREGFSYFKDGWDNFVKQHELSLGDFAVFEHKGDMNFDVIVFDPSACEKDYLPMKIAQEVIKREQSGFNIYEHVKFNKREKAPLEIVLSPNSSTEHPHFITEMKASNGIRHSPYLNIPAEFLKENDLSQTSIITLRDPCKKLWPVKLNFWSPAVSTRNYQRTGMATGWNEFYASNKLKEGDICRFELNSIKSKSKNIVLMDVQIFPRPI